ncbi:hypothetical protein GCM10007304_37510 [Rhodococcoides trifolii]|uniref:Uncharacterized protein n=1 Tax=Rhodococcoides trifolii TaxID=908250 RepID=A0A917G2R7_9NOCA|nr:hypothetical protein [Rhodococcus trifolii]GGG20120.1 hypothetical protein GCM10007304_37510 [Rhodococcus trifolii]
MTEDKTRYEQGSQESEDDAVDDSRTARAHAGEAITDARNWPGYFLVALGLAALGLALTAAGGGFEGWTMIAGVSSVVLIAAGIGLVLFQRKRVKAQEGKSLMDPGGH